jgi:hypothetical protein
VGGRAVTARHRLVIAGTIVAATLLALACRPRPTGNGPYADKVAADVPQIERAMGVKFKHPPKLEVRSRQQVREFLLQRLQEPEVQTAIGGQEATYKLLGLLPDTLKLSDFFVKVLTEQIIGYYDPKTKVLYVVDGAPEDYVGLTIMHELVHALQDQYVNLDSLQRISGDDDRQAAIQAVIEGQATYEQMFLMAGGTGNIAAQLPGGWEQIRASIREAQTTQPIFASAPMVIQESLLFPYINGAEFVRRFSAARKDKLAWDALPQSTEQVMHERAYFGVAPTRPGPSQAGAPADPDLPSAVTFPSTPAKVDENNFGEFGTRLFIYQHGKNQEAAIRAASGWDGDRYVLLNAGGGKALVWATVWDTAVDAAEFASGLDDVMLARFNAKATTTGNVRRFATANRTIEVSSREVSGRSVVFYVDVPAGASTAVLDLAKVQVTAR